MLLSYDLSTVRHKNPGYTTMLFIMSDILQRSIIFNGLQLGLFLQSACVCFRTSQSDSWWWQKCKTRCLLLSLGHIMLFRIHNDMMPSWSHKLKEWLWQKCNIKINTTIIIQNITRIH